MVKIEVRGFENVSRALKERLVDAVERAMPDMAQAGGMVIASEGRVLAPKKTSTLANSIDVWDLKWEGNRVTAKIGPSADVPYAAIQEYGGTITAKEKMLKVPITEAAKDGKAPDNLVLVYMDSQAFLMDPVTEIVHYVLRTSVRLPARPYMRPAYDTKQGETVDTMKAVLARAVNR